MNKRIPSGSLRLGAAISPCHLDSDDRFGEVLAREFNALTAENALKFRSLVREEGLYDFRDADRILEFAQKHGMVVRGHTLTWHQQYPDWLTEERFSPGEIGAILKQHINTVVGRYRGQVSAWDVVNEALEDDGDLRDTIWLRSLGPDYIERSFRWAHEADPNARLFYNDYGAEGLNPKSDAVYEMTKRLLGNGVPIHGVGLQMHLILGEHPSSEEIAENMRRLAALGVEIAVTEMDVRIPKPVTGEKLRQQAATYAEIAEVVLAVENCNEITLWGFTDRHSWIPGWYPETDSALIFDRDFKPKPAYDSLMNVLKRYRPDPAQDNS